MFYAKLSKLELCEQKTIMPHISKMYQDNKILYIIYTPSISYEIHIVERFQDISTQSAFVVMATPNL